MTALAQRSTQLADPALRARRLVEALGGRYSTELGIETDQGDDEVERWALAATLFGGRISAEIAKRTFAVLSRAGLRSVGDAERFDVGRLIGLLDEGGYARYDFQTAARLHRLAQALRELHCGRVSDALAGSLEEIEAVLDALPGWGPVTVGLFLRELRGARPGLEPALDVRALRGAAHLRLLPHGVEPHSALVELRALADAGEVDVRDLEAALVRLALAHGGRLADCPGGAECSLLAGTPGPGTARKIAMKAWR